MASSAAQKLAKEKYRQEKRDLLAVEIPKGKRDEYKAKAAELGLSLSMLIQHSVESYGESSAGNVPASSELTTEQKIFVDEFSKLPADVQKNFLKVFKAINASQTGDLPK